MDIKQEDLIRFWTWVGYSYRYSSWHEPNDFRLAGGKLSLPEITLDSLYKYAIPKLQNMGLAITLIAFEESGFNARIITVVPRTLQELANERAETPTEALYQAIMKVIDNEVK
jgi:hypothetical protein